MPRRKTEILTSPVTPDWGARFVAASLTLLHKVSMLALLLALIFPAYAHAFDMGTPLTVAELGDSANSFILGEISFLESKRADVSGTNTEKRAQYIQRMSSKALYSYVQLPGKTGFASLPPATINQYFVTAQRLTKALIPLLGNLSEQIGYADILPYYPDIDLGKSEAVLLLGDPSDQTIPVNFAMVAYRLLHAKTFYVALDADSLFADNEHAIDRASGMSVLARREAYARLRETLKQEEQYEFLHTPKAPKSGDASITEINQIVDQSIRASREMMASVIDNSSELPSWNPVNSESIRAAGSILTDTGWSPSASAYSQLIGFVLDVLNVIDLSRDMANFFNTQEALLTGLVNSASISTFLDICAAQNQTQSKSCLGASTKGEWRNYEWTDPYDATHKVTVRVPPEAYARLSKIRDRMAQLDAKAAGSKIALSVTKSGTGTGTLTLDGNACGDDCLKDYPDGANASISAAAFDSTSCFAGWTGGCEGAGSQCTVSMTQTRNIVANFSLLGNSGTQIAFDTSTPITVTRDTSNTCPGQVPDPSTTYVFQGLAISGRLVYQGTTNPVVGGNVTAVLDETDASGAVVSIALGTVQTAANGTFRFNTYAPEKAGSYKIRLTASYKLACDALPATTELDPPFDLPVIDPATGHDLRVVGFDLSRDTVPPGQNLTLTARIKNYGAANETNIPVALEIFAPGNTTTPIQRYPEFWPSLDTSTAAQQIQKTLPVGTAVGLYEARVTAGPICYGIYPKSFRQSRSFYVGTAPTPDQYAELQGFSLNEGDGNCLGSGGPPVTVGSGYSVSLLCAGSGQQAKLRVAKGGIVLDTPTVRVDEWKFLDGNRLILRLDSSSSSDNTAWGTPYEMSTSNNLDIQPTILAVRAGGVATFRVTTGVAFRPDYNDKVDIVVGTGMGDGATVSGWGRPTYPNVSGDGKSFDLNLSVPASAAIKDLSGAPYEFWVSVETSQAVTGRTTGAFLQKLKLYVTPPYALNIQKQGTGAGTVTSSDGGISCGTKCMSDYGVNAAITLTAAPGSGSTFIGWSGCTPVVANPYQCTLAMDSAKFVSVRFGAAIPTDTTAPTIAILSPTSGGTHAAVSASLNLSGTASDNVGVTQVTWSNSLGGSGTAGGTATNWSANGITLYNGNNVITVTARDAEGNTGTATLAVSYTAPDTTAPTISILSPTSGGSHAATSASLNLSGTASDNVGVTQVTWSNSLGGSGAAGGTTTNWSANGITLRNGGNVITVTARDAAGNTNSATLTVSYTAADTTAPSISIVSPTSGSTYTASGASLNLSGTASDNVGVTQVTWSNSQGGSGTAGGAGTWSVSGIALYNGSNLITVTAKDAAGNTGTATLTVIFGQTSPPSAPAIGITTPGNAQATVNFTAPASNGGAAITGYTVASSPAGGVDSDAGTTALTHTVTGLTNGVSYTFIVTASNSAGAGSPSAPSSAVTPKGAQVITFGSAPGVVVGGTGTIIASGGGSGNPLVLTSTTQTVCTISGSTVTGVAAGTCTIAANQAASVAYSAAAQVTQSFTVSPTSATNAARAGVEAMLAQLVNTINTKGENLDYTDVLTYYDAGFLSAGLGATDSARSVVSEIRGVSLGPISVIKIYSYDDANGIVNVSAATTVTVGSTQIVKQFDGYDSDGLFIFRRQGDGSWKFYGNRQIARIDVAGEMNTQFGPGYLNGPRQIVSFNIAAPVGTLSKANGAHTLTASPNPWGSALPVSMPATNAPAVVSSKWVQASPLPAAAVALPNQDAFNAYFVTGASPLHSGQAFQAALTKADGPFANYNITYLGNVVSNTTTGAITNVSLNGGTAVELAAADARAPLSLAWVLPSGYGVAQVNLFGAVRNNLGEVCRASDQRLSPTATSGTINLPSSCTGTSGNGNITSGWVSIYAFGANGETSSYWYNFNISASSAPTIGTAAGGNGSAMVGFTAPGSDGGSPIVSYTATCAASGQLTRSITGNAPPLTVTGLTNGVAYACSVVATNGFGATSGSSDMVSVTPTPLQSTDGFESGGWTMAQVNGTGGTWVLGSAGIHPGASPHGGSTMAVFNSYSSKSGSQTRLGQAGSFSIPASHATATLRYWIYHDTGYAGSNDRVQVQVSTDGTTWTNVGTPSSRYNGTTGWEQVNVDLSGFIGQTQLRLGFLGISEYGNDIYLDDARVEAGGTTTGWSDDFAKGLGNWTLYGSPQPRWLASAQGRSGVFDNNGDSSFNSGAVSKALAGGAGGFSIQADVFLEFSSLSGCWAGASLGLTQHANPVFGSGGENEAWGLYMSLDASGEACLGSPADKRRHAYFNIGILADDATWESFDPYSFNADGYANGWHTLRIQVNADRSVQFYIDNTPIWKPTNKLDPALLTGRNVVLGTRSSGSAGKAFHDSVIVGQAMQTTTPPGAPAIGTVTAGNALATVNFTASGSDGGSPITTYTATCAASGQTIHSNTGSPPSITVSNLTNGVPYSCRVIATNANGDSAPSALSSSVTPSGPGVWLSASSLSFVSRPLGTSSGAESVVLANNGNAALAISSIVTSGDFAHTKTCGASLAVEATCTISITFAPTATGSRAGNLSIVSDAVGSPHGVSLGGTGTAATLTIPLTLRQGWNLLGNSLNQTLSVATLFGNGNVVSAVWKWDAPGSRWLFFTPLLDAAALQNYAIGKGFGVLAQIAPGDGYWVNAKVAANLAAQTGSVFVLTGASLAPGWNLVATAQDVAPSAFNRSLSNVPPSPGVVPQNIVSLWAWDNPANAWYFYAPSLDAQGGTGLVDYIGARGYLDFAQHGKTLGNGTGFWVNKSLGALSADLRGYWAIYRTPSGGSESFPLYIQFAQANNSLTGMSLCGNPSTVAGTLSGNSITLSWSEQGAASIVGTTSGWTMSGSYSFTGEQGTWRGERLASPPACLSNIAGLSILAPANSGTYEVWVGDQAFPIPNSNKYFSVANQNYFRKATSTGGNTDISGRFKYYVIVTQGNANIDAIRLTTGGGTSYLSQASNNWDWGNLENDSSIFGAPDSGYASLGMNRNSGGPYSGYFLVENTGYTPTSTSATYKVWGGNTHITGVDGYDPGSHGYTLLGQSTTTQTFSGAYQYYIVTVDTNAVALIDAIKGSDGVYYGANNTGNTQRNERTDGAPDGKSALVGLHQDGGYFGGYAGIATPGLSSVTIYVGN